MESVYKHGAINWKTILNALKKSKEQLNCCKLFELKNRPNNGKLRLLALMTLKKRRMLILDALMILTGNEKINKNGFSAF